MRYAITLTFQSGGMLQLPILPEKLKVSSPGKNKTATVLGIGEVLLLRLKGLRSVSWDSFFPASSAPYVTGSIITPVEAVRAIQTARDSREPVQFTLSGSDLDINTQMGVEDFSYDERFGAVGDIYYSIKLSEWKDYSPRRLILSDSGTKTAAAETPKERGGATPGGTQNLHGRSGRQPMGNIQAAVRIRLQVDGHLLCEQGNHRSEPK